MRSGEAEGAESEYKILDIKNREKSIFNPVVSVKWSASALNDNVLDVIACV